jgi:hypothetical protein
VLKTITIRIGTIALFALELAMAGCGSGSNSTNISGNWSASLTGSPTGPTIYSFTTSFTESSGGGLSITNFTLTSNGSCFVPGETSESGSFTLNSNSSGNVTGTFGMTVTSQATGEQNVLTLQGGVSGNNTITGTWSVSGTPACVGNGVFVINRM